MKEHSENQENSKKQHNDSGMAMRGVTRPMAEQQIRQAQHKKKEEGNGHEDQHNGHQHMGHDERMQMLRMHHMQTLWVYWMLVLLGIWMVLSPLTFSYGKGTVDPSGGREVWLTLQQRISFMTWSDIISGLLLIFFGWRSLTPNRPVSMWICCLIGVWISAAPLLFWAPNAAAYLNGTLVGALVIALTILIPGMPNMITYMKMGSQVPPGWSYNPSSWPQLRMRYGLGPIPHPSRQG